MPAQELESVCGPAKAVMVPIVRRWNWKRNDFTTPAPLATIHSHRYDARRTLYTKGDELNIDAGTIKGLEVGRNLVVRRYFRANGNADTAAATGEHTAGLVQIVAAGEHSSTAVVVHACNELMKGDFLAAFNPEPVRTLEPAGTPAYEDAMRILFADDGQSLGVPRRLMVIDRRSEQALQAGQRLTLFRRSTAAAKPVILGEAIVIAVRTDSATIRVMSATDAIWSGDWAAPQRPSAAGSPVAKTSTHPQR